MLNKCKLISHFNSICHLNSSLPCNITYFQVLRIRVGGAPFFSTILRLQNYKQLCISKSLCLASNKTASTKYQVHSTMPLRPSKSLNHCMYFALLKFTPFLLVLDGSLFIYQILIIYINGKFCSPSPKVIVSLFLVDLSTQ